MANDIQGSTGKDRSMSLEESNQRVREKLLTKQASISSNFLNVDCTDLKQRLKKHYASLESWKLHHDFDLWDKAEFHLSQIWTGLRSALCLAMECGLYEEVKDIFLEIRHLLQTAGFVKDHICLAAWLRAEAERRDDWAIKYLMMSSLAWSYTSFGGHQDLPKANELWDDIVPFLLKVGDPNESNKYREYLQDNQDRYPYTELLVDIYETGVRIAVRCARLEDAKRYTQKGRAEIANLSKGGFLSARLKERFDIAFCYHEGVAAFRLSKYEKARELFNDTILRGEFIAWVRLVRGAKSWLATIAIELKEYKTCESILTELTEAHFRLSGKRDVMCHLIRAQLLRERGQHVEKAESKQKAISTLEEFIKVGDSVDAVTCDIDSFRLKPCSV